MANNGNNAWGNVEFHIDNTAGITPNSVNQFIKSSKKEEDAIIKREIEAQAREAARKKARRVQWNKSVKNGHLTLNTKRQGFLTNENAIKYMSSPSKVAFRNATRQARSKRAEKQNMEENSKKNSKKNKEGGSYRRKKATRKNRNH